MTSFTKLLILIIFIPINQVFAQDIKVDKSSGLVQVDGQDVFYLKAANKVLWQKDYSLTNIDGEELAYLKAEQGREWNSASRQYQDATYFGVTFSKSGNYCELHGFTSLSIIKSLSKTIVSAHLVQNGQISTEAEQKFIVMHNGTFLHNPNVVPQVVINVPVSPITQQTSTTSIPPEISLSKEKIYNHDQLIGTFRQTEKNSTITITVYNTGDAEVTRASHSGEDDWRISPQGKTIRFYAEKSLEKLFASLVSQGVF
ncbi:MAG: hypothetical protein ABI378_11500 [Chitinophagaceae bacterium]